MESEASSEKPSSKKFLFLFIILFFILAGVAAWWFLCYQKKDRSIQVESEDPVTIIQGSWSGRDSHASVVFHDKMWIFGGKDNSVEPLNDIWFSSDGQIWYEAVGGERWAARWGHIVFEFQDKLWLMGGTSDEKKMYNDVWSSSDGLHWSLVKNNSGWPSRSNFSGVVYQDKMFVMGGWTSEGVSKSFSDVWSTQDGIEWTQLTSDAKFGARSFQFSFVYKNKLYIGGGIDNQKKYEFKDMYSSSDGAIWTKVSTLLSPRIASSVCFENDSIYLIAGYSLSDTYNDVLVSEDGSTWQKVIIKDLFPKRAFHTCAIYNGKLWIMGGYDFASERKNDIWSIELSR